MNSPDLYERLLRGISRSGLPSSDYDLNTDVVLPDGRALTPAAVLIAIHPEHETVVLTKRSARLKHHPGQIAFPGGKQDGADASPIAAALREAKEEVGLPTDAVDVLGTLPAHETVTGFTVTPVISVLNRSFIPRPEAGEVSEIFHVPLAHLVEANNYGIQSRRWQGKPRYYYTVPYGPYYVWGATARILRALADRMQI